MPTHFATKERILNAAEGLFAAHGFAGASSREITRLADVNLAAINYHFGSKENLVQEVFRRRLDFLSSRRLTALEDAMTQKPPNLETVVAAFIVPALDLATDPHGGPEFVRVLARAYVDQNERLRQFLSDNYGHVLKQFAAAVARCLPDLPLPSLYARLDFIAGALTYAMADFGVTRKAASVRSRTGTIEPAVELVAFACAGLRADSGP